MWTPARGSPKRRGPEHLVDCRLDYPMWCMKTNHLASGLLRSRPFRSLGHSQQALPTRASLPPENAGFKLSQTNGRAAGSLSKCVNEPRKGSISAGGRMRTANRRDETERGGVLEWTLRPQRCDRFGPDRNRHANLFL